MRNPGRNLLADGVNDPLGIQLEDFYTLQIPAPRRKMSRRDFLWLLAGGAALTSCAPLLKTIPPSPPAPTATETLPPTSTPTLTATPQPTATPEPTPTPTPDVLGQARQQVEAAVAASGGLYRLTPTADGKFSIEAQKKYPDPPHDWPEPTPAPTPEVWDGAVEVTQSGAVIHTTDYYQNEQKSDITIPLQKFTPKWDTGRKTLLVTDPASGREYSYSRLLETWVPTELRAGVPLTDPYWDSANWVDAGRLKLEGMGYIEEYLAQLIPLERELLRANPDFTGCSYSNSIYGVKESPFSEIGIIQTLETKIPILSVSRMEISGHTQYLIGIPFIPHRQLDPANPEKNFGNTIIMHMLVEDDAQFNWYKSYGIAETTIDHSIGIYTDYVCVINNIQKIREHVGWLIGDGGFGVFIFNNKGYQKTLLEDENQAEKLGYFGALAVWDAYHNDDTIDSYGLYLAKLLYSLDHVTPEQKKGYIQVIENSFLPCRNFGAS